MKKNFYVGLIALTALTVTSCSNDDVVMQSPEVNKAIEFGTYVGRDAVSRGSVHTLETLAGTDNPGFGVFAYYTDEDDYVATSTAASEGSAATTASQCNFMYNQQVTGTSSTTGEGDDAVTTYSWTYSPVKYWPNDPDDKLTFFAYAPYDDADANAADDEVDNISFSAQDQMNGDPVITFTVNNTVKDQTDLLFSKSDTKNLVKNAEGEGGIYIDEKVNFQFAHALSRIGFTVKAIVDEVSAGTPAETLDGNTTIVVKKVILSGATHTAAADDNFVAPSTGIFYTQGELNINQQDVNETDEGGSTYNAVNWTNIVGDGDGADENKQIFTLENDNFVAQTETDYDSEGFVITGGDNGNSTTANPLNAEDSYIMIIPQDFTGSNSAFYVYVEYDVITKDTNLGNEENAEYSALKSKITNHISTQVSNINFQSGKAYTLNLQLGMTSVKVTANVDGWGDATGTEVNLPINTQQQEQNP